MVDDSPTIVALLKRMLLQNHFEVLGIPRASNEAQVKEAYFRLARRESVNKRRGS